LFPNALPTWVIFRHKTTPPDTAVKLIVLGPQPVTSPAYIARPQASIVKCACLLTSQSGTNCTHSSRKRVKQSKKRKKSRFLGFSKNVKT